MKSRKNGSFKLVPVSESDMLISKEYILEPDADLDRAITMDELLQGVKADIHEFRLIGSEISCANYYHNLLFYGIYMQI